MILYILRLQVLIFPRRVVTLLLPQHFKDRLPDDVRSNIALVAAAEEVNSITTLEDYQEGTEQIVVN